MSLLASVQWEVRTTGSDTNGGGFTGAPGGTDYSQQDTAQIAVTDAVTNGTTTITSATANFTSDMVGNVCYVAGGTGSITASWYEITAVNSTTSITVDRATGLTAGTGVTLNLGGAMASPGGMAGALALSGVGTAGQIVNIKSGSYTIGTGTANTSGNRVNTSAAAIWWGYQTTHGDGGTKPILVAGGNSITLFTCASGGASTVDNLEFQPGTFTGISGLTTTSSQCTIRNCKCTNCNTAAFSGAGAQCLFFNCEASGTGGSQAGFVGTGGSNRYLGCTAHGGTVAGFTLHTADIASDCIAYANSSHGFQVLSSGGTAALVRCLAYGNTGTAINGFQTNQGSTHFIGCLAISNGTAGAAYGFQALTATSDVLIDCAAYGNFGGDTNGTFLINSGFVSLSGDPTTDGAGGDFSLNSTAGAGAACKAAGWPSSWPGVSGTTGYPDIGPVQSQSTGGTGGATNIAY